MEKEITFYEKPGCKGNAKQKNILKDLGYRVNCVDILSEKWNKEKLMKFFQDLPIHNCVNIKAPMITKGVFKVTDLTEAEIIEEMILYPILIKRPLLIYQNSYAVGFENPLIEKITGKKQLDMKCKKVDTCTP